MTPFLSDFLLVARAIPLDDQEQRALDFVVGRLLRGHRTSTRDIALELGLSDAETRVVMHALEEKGMLAHHPIASS